MSRLWLFFQNSAKKCEKLWYGHEIAEFSDEKSDSDIAGGNEGRIQYISLSMAHWAKEQSFSRIELTKELKFKIKR